MIALAEAVEHLPPSASQQDIRSAIEAARLAGFRIFTIPADFSRCETADNALAHIVDQERETTAIWIGYIPDLARYAAIYEAARARNICLVNNPAQHQTAQEFDSAYPLLGDLTPASEIVTDAGQALGAAERLGFPVFLKGAVQSRKSRGWRACVAESEAEVSPLAEGLFALENRSRGRVVIRRLIRLRHTRTAPGSDFPLGREYRIFLYSSRILTLAYYWEGDDPDKSLSPTEEQTVRMLAEEAARRVGTPYLAVDIGQAEDGKWWVIETGDAQFSGLSQNNPLTLWHQLAESLSGSES